MKPLYLEKLDQRGNLVIWLVDGEYIRGQIDEEFTNFGQHFRFSFIPKNELWLDQEATPDERAFFIDHLLTEWRLMHDGASYDEALAAADDVERRERKRNGDALPIGPAGSAGFAHVRCLHTTANGLNVWLVNGRLVRDKYDIDFTEGGHDQVYTFIPEREIWLDNDVEPEEWGFVLLHELHERNRMANDGIWYDAAHAESSRLEWRCRHHPNELDAALEAEGW